MYYYKHNIGDYDAATLHLSNIEDLAYTRLLRWYYLNERPIPENIEKISKLIRFSSKKEINAIRSVLEEFFVLKEDGWHQARANREIEKFYDKSGKAKTAAETRWQKQDENAGGMRTHTRRNPIQDTITKKQEIDTSSPPSSSRSALKKNTGDGGGFELESEILIDQRLAEIGIRQHAKITKIAVQHRTPEDVLSILDYFVANFRLPDGAFAWKNGPAYLTWRIGPECQENDPSKDWMPPDNPEFIRQKRAVQNIHAGAAVSADRAASEARRKEPSAIEAEYGKAVDALSWDDALPLLPPGPILKLAHESRRADETPGQRPVVRSALLCALQKSAQSPGPVRT